MKSKIIVQDIESIVSELAPNLSFLEDKEILVTGGNGLIPSYVVDTISTFNSFLERPCKITVMNRSQTTSSSRLSHLLRDPNITFISQDVGKKFNVPGNPQIIIHAASRANPVSFLKKPIDTIYANVEGMKTLLDYSKNKDLDAFLFFSSSEVYGDPSPENIPTPETYPGNLNCLGDMACYSESKRLCETLGKAFFKEHGVPFQSLRIFHTFGPGIRNDGKTIANIFYQGMNEGKISLKDSGTSKRSYSYVSDTVRGIFYVLLRGTHGEAYNVGTDLNNVSVKEMVEIVGSSLGGVPVSIPPDYSSKINPILNRAPDISKLRSLGFEPKFQLKEGIERLRDHYLEVGF